MTINSTSPPPPASKSRPSLVPQASKTKPKVKLRTTQPGTCLGPFKKWLPSQVAPSNNAFSSWTKARRKMNTSGARGHCLCSSCHKERVASARDPQAQPRKTSRTGIRRAAVTKPTTITDKFKNVLTTLITTSRHPRARLKSNSLQSHGPSLPAKAS